MTDLDDRQRRILQLLADGRSYPQIAAEMFLSSMTVKNHVSRIYKLLGARNAAQAVAVAYQRGMLVPGPDGAVRAESSAILAAPTPDGYRVALVPWRAAS